MSTPMSVPSARSEVRPVVPRLIELKGHTERALADGVTREEIGELIGHLAFYAGWASAMSAARVAKQIFEEKTT